MGCIIIKVFIETPSLAGLPAKVKEPLLLMRHDYTPPDANPVFQGRGFLSFLLSLHMVVDTYYSGVSIVDFEQANVCWKPTKNPTTIKTTILKQPTKFVRRKVARTKMKQDFTFVVIVVHLQSATITHKKNSKEVNFKDKNDFHDNESI